jgi:branched-chain amino acid transport system ATP-binding protein
MLLEVNNLSISYGKAMAVNDVSIHVSKGDVVCLIGANGAGKTSVLRAISGLIPDICGEIRFDGRIINGMPVEEIVKLGLIHVPQGRKLFPFLSVLSNLHLGASVRRDKQNIKDDLEEIFDFFPALYKKRKLKAGSLSGGEQEMLAIGRGMMSKPRLLMLDEPSLGLAPLIVQELVTVTKRLKNKGISILLVEQDMSLALKAAVRGYALQVGSIAMHAGIEEFKCSDIVKRLYLGE